MKRITAILKESEVMTVRKAVCAIAGTEHVVITPIPYRMCGVDLVDLYSEKINTGSGRQVRFDVTADDSMAVGVVAAIRRIAQAGKISFSSLHARLPKRVI
jgi:nitrogen regulatory protein PII